MKENTCCFIGHRTINETDELRTKITEAVERLITDEVNANNIETITRCELWLEQLKNSADATNKMFGTSVSVDWRHNPDEMIVTNTPEGEFYYGKNR